VEIRDVEAPHPAPAGLVVGHVPGVAAHALVAAGAEGGGSLAGQHDHANVDVLPGALERVAQLDHRLRAERVVDLGPVDRDLRDPVRDLVADVGVVASARAPCRGGADGALLGGHRRAYDNPLDDWLTLRARTHGDRPAVIDRGGTVTYAELDLAAAVAARRLAAR